MPIVKPTQRKEGSELCDQPESGQMTIVKTSSDEWAAYKDEIILRLRKHGWYGRAPHHFNTDSIRMHGGDKGKLEKALKELEIEGWIHSAKRPVLTTRGIALARDLRKRQESEQLRKNRG